MSWFFSVFSLELRKLLSYRTEVWLQAAGSIFGHMAAAYFLWRAIFASAGATEMQGYTFGGIMLYYLLIPLIDHVMRGADNGGISREIYDGTLTRYLLYPLSFFGYRLAARAAEAAIAAFQMLLVIAIFLIFFGEPEGARFALPSVFAAVLMLTLSFLVYFQLSAIVELLAFWADHVWSLSVFLRFLVGFLGGGMIPLAFFPSWSRFAIEALPFAHMVSLPIRLFMGIATSGELWEGACLLIGWSLVLMLPVGFLWRRGLGQYTGVGI
ncbi:MAG: ABC-2 family transporter protein [Spirochaetales bacterium]|nr:ABC-2 family transporter protein [Leptospiraceae bacterium]MCP5482775.1 ABC-2 family transporter protein [Spirochaetales bacterium]